MFSRRQGRGVDAGGGASASAILFGSDGEGVVEEVKVDSMLLVVVEVGVGEAVMMASGAAYTFDDPSVNKPVTASSPSPVVSDGGRNVYFAIESHAIGQDATVVFRISSLTTPTKQVASASATSKRRLPK